MITVMITWRYLAFDLRDITGSISAPQAAQASSVVLTVRRLGGVLIRAMQPFSGHPPAKGNRESTYGCAQGGVSLLSSAYSTQR